MREQSRHAIPSDSVRYRKAPAYETRENEVGHSAGFSDWIDHPCGDSDFLFPVGPECGGLVMGCVPNHPMSRTGGNATGPLVVANVIAALPPVGYLER